MFTKCLYLPFESSHLLVGFRVNSIFKNSVSLTESFEIYYSSRLKRSGRKQLWFTVRTSTVPLTQAKATHNITCRAFGKRVYGYSLKTNQEKTHRIQYERIHIAFKLHIARNVICLQR